MAAFVSSPGGPPVTYALKVRLVLAAALFAAVVLGPTPLPAQLAVAGVRVLTGLTTGTPALAPLTGPPLMPWPVSSVALTTLLPPKAVVLPANLSFGVVKVNTTSSPLLLTIQNTGGQTLKITGVASTDPHFTVSPASLNVTPGASASLTVTFTPDAEAAFSGAVTGTTNEPGPVNVGFSGTGACPISRCLPLR